MMIEMKEKLKVCRLFFQSLHWVKTNLAKVTATGYGQLI